MRIIIGVLVLLALGSVAEAKDLTITIPDASTSRIEEAICTVYGERNKAGLACPQFVEAIVLSFLKEVTVAYEANRDAETARKAAQDKAVSEIDLDILKP